MEDMEKRLDASLEIALAMHDLGYPVTFFDKAGRVVEKGEIGYFPNILLVGQTGIGKTALIRDWAQKNDINLMIRACQHFSDDLAGKTDEQVIFS